MYSNQCQTKKFDTEDVSDLVEYDAILNNPCCVIIKEYKEKLRQEFYDDEGTLATANERIILVVTWTEKTLS